MHELAVTESILSITLKHAGRAGAQRVTGVNLVIGELASIVDDSVCFYWDLISEGTLAAGARLQFRRIPAQFECQDCHQVYGLGGEEAGCMRCHSLRVKVTAGEEFYLDSIEVE